MTDDEWLAQWRQWLESIRDEVQYMLHSRSMYNEFWQIIEANERIRGPNAFYAWVNMMYAGYMAVAVRRQLDMDTRSVSMARLLTDISEHPSALSRQSYMTQFRAGLQRAADEQFSRFAGDANAHIDPGIPRRDLDQLKQSGARVRGFVNQKVAHTDLHSQSASATYGELNDCVALLESLVTKYHNLLTAQTYTTLVPVILEPWKRIFREPWIAPRRSAARGAQGSGPATRLREEQDR